MRSALELEEAGGFDIGTGDWRLVGFPPGGPGG